MITQKAISLLQDLIRIESFSNQKIKLLIELKHGLMNIIFPFQDNIIIFGLLIKILIPNYRPFY